MSSYRNRDLAEELKDEERSADSREESQGDRDFIAPEGFVEEDLDLTLSTADILARGRSSDRLDVSIFNTSVSGGGSRDSSAPLLVRGGEGQGRAISLGLERESGSGTAGAGRTMRVGDLNPSLEMDSKTVKDTGSDHSGFDRFPEMRPMNPSGERRQAERQTGLSTLEKGVTTLVTRAQAPARDPKWTEDRTKEVRAGLPTHLEPETIPSKPARPKTKGEAIGLKWSYEEDEEEQPVAQMSYEDEVGLLGLTTQRKLEEHFLGMEALNALCVDRAVLVARQEKEAAVNLVEAQEDYRASGPIGVMLQEVEPQSYPQLSLLEFIAGRGQDAEDDYKLFKASRKTEFTWKEIVALMEETSRLLPLVKDDMERVLGKEVMAETIRRHYLLEEGLSSGEGEISRETARMFPRVAAIEILQWYSRLVAGMVVMISEGQKFKRTTAILAEFVENYPGPDVPPVIRQQPDQESWRGSLQARLLGEDSVSRYQGLVEMAESQHGSDNSRQERSPKGASKEEKDRARPRTEKSFLAERDRAVNQAGPAGQEYRMRSSKQREDGPFGDYSERNLQAKLLSNDLVRSRREQDLGKSSRELELERELQQKYAEEYTRRDQERDRAREQEDREDGSRGGSSRSSKMMGFKSVTRPLMDGMVEDLEEYVEVDGFETLTREELEASIRAMVVQKLKEQGCDSEIARNIICDRWPMFNLHPRKGKTEEVRYFDRSAKLVKPTSKGSFMAMDDWFEAMKEQGDSQGWSIRHRIKWLKTTGGLAMKVNDAILGRVKDKMKTIQAWIPDFDASLPSVNNNYWFQVWADVAVMLIKEFFTTQHADQVEDAYMAGLAEKKFAIDESQSDPLNKEWYKFSGSWEAQETMLIKRGSEYLSSPLFVWNMFKRWWEKQGKRGAGKMMVDIIERALNKLSTNPQEVFPAYHNLSDDELEEVRRKGKGGASMNTYGLIMEFYKRKAGLGELTMVFTDFKMMDAMTRQDGGAFERSNADKKKERKANAALKKAASPSSDVSALTLNTAVTRNPVACSLCGLYHTFSPSCPLVKDGKMAVESVIKYRSLREINADGTSSFNKFWRKKFRIFVLPKLGIISEEDQAKWFKKVDDALAKIPVASAEAIKRYQQENAKFINLTKEEESRDGGIALGVVARDKAARKQEKKAQLALVEEEEESSDSESGISGSEASYDMD